MLDLQAVDLIVMFTNEQGLQSRQVGVFLRPDITGGECLSLRTIDDPQVVAGGGLHMSISKAQAGCGLGIRAIDR